jgi:hypothetical protein
MLSAKNVKLRKISWVHFQRNRRKINGLSCSKFWDKKFPIRNGHEILGLHILERQ